MARPLKPRTPLAERLIEVREKLGFMENRSGFAERLGLLPDTLGSYERGIAAPAADVLARYHREFGVNISWLVSGDGIPLDDPSKAPAPNQPMDPDLLEAIYKTIELVHRATNLKTPPHKLAVLAAEMYNDLLGRVADVRDRAIVNAVIPVLGDELKERLQEATSEPGAGKRSAS